MTYRSNHPGVVGQIFIMFGPGVVIIDKSPIDFVRALCPKPVSSRQNCRHFGPFGKKGDIGFQKLSLKVFHVILATHLGFGFPAVTVTGLRKIDPTLPMSLIAGKYGM